MMIERKSLKELSWDVDEPTYRQGEGISYSTLSAFQREGIEVLTSKEKLDTESLRFGSLVDCLITEPELIEERFIIQDFNKPSQALCDIAKGIFAECGATSIRDVPDECILSVADKYNYSTNWKLETRIRTIKAKCEEYFRFLSFSQDKAIMSCNDLAEAKRCVETLKTHPFTWSYFTPTAEERANGGVERLFQLKFRAEYHGIPIRCMFDLLIVDHNKKVIHPCDLKTTSSKEYKFITSVEKWGYYLQAELYTYILKEVLANDKYFKDFEVEDFKFIVINRHRCKPMVWSYPICNPSLTYYNHSYLDSCGYKPWPILLEEVYFHTTEGKYDYPKEIYENNGVGTILFNEVPTSKRYED